MPRQLSRAPRSLFEIRSGLPGMAGDSQEDFLLNLVGHHHNNVTAAHQLEHLLGVAVTVGNAVAQTPGRG